ncbi:MAG: Ig-like domain-containing protein, partial [Verrucomicrobiota bacterium]
YPVRCVVSDKKGGRASRYLVVTIGSPTPLFRIEGRVTFDGEGLENVRVHLAHDTMAWTDSDGFYAIVGLTSGVYTAAAQQGTKVLTPSFSNPLDLGTGIVSKADFTGATPPGLLFTEDGNGLDVYEGGSNETLHVRLATPPANDVSVQFTQTFGQAEIEFSPPSLVFTPFNWTQPVAVVVSAIDDPDVESPIQTVTLSQHVTSGDPAYHGLPGTNLSVNIHDNETNHPPIAMDDFAYTLIDTPVDFCVLTNDVDPDGNLDTTRIQIFGQSLGNMNFNGVCRTYTPNPGITGTDLLSYIVYDTFNLNDQGQVTVVIDRDTDGDGTGNRFDRDDDNDYMYDDWETLYGFDPLTSNVLADTDGDGVFDPDEFVALTDPTNADDRFEVAIEAGLDHRIQWYGASNRFYRLEQCTDLGSNTWQSLSPPRPGSNRMMSAIATGRFDRVYFRIRVSLP